MESDANPTPEGAPDFFSAHALGDNALRILPSGAWTDQARQDLIRNATRSIYMSAFAIEDDETGRGFLALLMQRAQAGVDVRFVADSFGAKAIKRYRQQLRDGGVRVLFYNP